jgi:hypothetical protein
MLNHFYPVQSRISAIHRPDVGQPRVNDPPFLVPNEYLRLDQLAADAAHDAALYLDNCP